MLYLVVVTEQLEEVELGLMSREDAVTGRSTIRVHSPLAAIGAVAGADASESEAGEVSARPGASALAAWRRLRCSIVYLSAHSGGSRSGGTVSVGRSSDQDVVLRHRAISKAHAVLGVADNDWSLTDLGGRNHTYVNQVRVDGRVPLKPGDELQFACIRAQLVTGEDLWSAVRTGTE